MLRIFSCLLLFVFIWQTTTNRIHALDPKPTIPQKELIVKYKPGQSPEELRIVILQREEKKKNFFSFFIILVQDIKTHITYQETPKDKLARIEAVEKKAGVVSQEPLSNKKPFEHTYLMRLKEPSSISNAISLYKSLPEVEYVEENSVNTIR